MISVVCFGDSLTWGAGSGSSFTAGNAGPEGSGYEGDSYPAQLQRLSGWAVSNQGIFGDLVTSGSTNDPQNGTDRLQGLIPTLTAGTIVMVLLGINDAAQLRTPTAIVNGYKRMIADAQAASLPLFLATLPPSNWSFTEVREATREAVNNWIRERPGDQASIIDLEANLASSNRRIVSPEYSANGRTLNPNTGHPHLNPVGNAVVAQAVYDGINNPVSNLPPYTYS